MRVGDIVRHRLEPEPAAMSISQLDAERRQVECMWYWPGSNVAMRRWYDISDIEALQVAEQSSEGRR